MHLTRHRGRPAVGLVIICALVLGWLVAAASSAQASPQVVRAGHASTRADRLLVTKARLAARCRRDCADRRRAVQRAGDRLSFSTQRLTRAVQATSVASTARRQPIPALAVRGRRLTWRPQARLDVYVLSRTVAGQAAAFSLVHGTRATPPAAPGTSVTYAVRRAVRSAGWSAPVTIAYPAARTAKALRPVDAPQVTATAQQVSWTRVAAVRDYVVAARSAGRPTTYQVVRGTTLPSAPAAGQPVTYSVRTAVVDSAWGTSQPVTPAPAQPVPAPVPVPVPVPAPAPVGRGAVPGATPTGFQFGVTAAGGQSQLNAVRSVGARHIRIEFDINRPIPEIAQSIEPYIRAGVQPVLLAGFYGRVPTSAEAQKLGAWAAAFGPGGSQWTGKGLPASAAVTLIEFGNETNYTYQFPSQGGVDDPAFAARARLYAQRARDAATAIRAANANVGLLLVAESSGDVWINAMFDSVPDLGSFVAGWTVHPYLPDWQPKMDGMLAAVRRRGAPDRPLYITEVGFASDGGRCLSDNYKWDPCMSFEKAAATLGANVSAMRARYGSRLAAIYVYSATDLGTPGASTDREQYFGVLRRDGSAKGAYTAKVRELLAANP